MKTTPDQLSLPLFDTTALTSSMGLYSGLSFGEPVHDAIAETGEDAPAPVVVPARNFRLTGARRLAPDWKTRAADNIAAIRLMRQIEEEARNAAPEEQERLALFTSFGASDLANNVFRRSAEDAFPKGWETLGEDLEQFVSPGELASLARVTQYAHFTPEFMVRAMWRALRHMGFSGGRVLEPGCGTGLFFALMPEALETKTTLTGVEMDPIAARITKLLYPNARIRARTSPRRASPRLTISSSATRRSAAAPSAPTIRSAGSVCRSTIISLRGRSSGCVLARPDRPRFRGSRRSTTRSATSRPLFANVDAQPPPRPALSSRPSPIRDKQRVP
jgi:hypothetical protein